MENGARTRRATLAGLAGAFAGVVAVACGGDAAPAAKPAEPTKAPAAAPTAAKPAEPTKAPAAQPTTAPAAAQSGGAKTLPDAKIAWETFRGGDGTWPELMIKTFKEKFPNVTVEYRPIALDGGNQQSAYPKMLAAAQAGSLGDLHAWDPSHWQMYQAAKRKIIAPIDDLIARDKYDLAQFFKPFIDYQKWQGKTWGLPSWGWTGQDGFLYNTQLLEAAGVKLPDPKSADWTMAKLYEIVVQVGRYMQKTNGFGLVTTLPSSPGTTTFTRAFNGDKFSEDGKKAILTEPAAKEAMRWAYDLSNKEKVIAHAENMPKDMSADQMFVSGQIGITHQGSLGVFNINKLNKDGALKFQSVLFPKRKDGKRPSELRGGTWNINAATKSTDQTWEFLKHIVSKDGALAFNTMSGNQANVRPDIMKDKYFADPNFQNYLENFEGAMVHIIPSNLRGMELDPVFAEKGNPWYFGKVGFEDGLKAWNDELQRILDQPEL